MALLYYSGAHFSTETGRFVQAILAFAELFVACFRGLLRELQTGSFAGIFTAAKPAVSAEYLRVFCALLQAVYGALQGGFRSMPSPVSLRSTTSPIGRGKDPL